MESMPITLPELAAQLIRSFEGCRLVAYRDSVGVWTIGFGHTLGVAAGQTITMEQAEAFLAQDMASLLAMVKDKPLVEAAALVSFGYNCGAASLANVLAGKSALTEFVHAKDRATGAMVVLSGLEMRRGVEDALIRASQQMLLPPTS